MNFVTLEARGFLKQIRKQAFQKFTLLYLTSTTRFTYIIEVRSIVSKYYIKHYTRIIYFSRTSLMTGRRPDTTLVYANDRYWRNYYDISTFPQYLKEEGSYTSVGLGACLQI